MGGSLFSRSWLYLWISAPASSSALTTDALLPIQASARIVIWASYQWPRAFGSAPALNRRFTTSKCPFLTAQNNAGPDSYTSSGLFMSAPASSNRFTMWRFPVSAARDSGGLVLRHMHLLSQRLSQRLTFAPCSSSQSTIAIFEEDTAAWIGLPERWTPPPVMRAAPAIMLTSAPAATTSSRVSTWSPSTAAWTGPP